MTTTEVSDHQARARLDALRRHLRGALEGTPSFTALPEKDRHAIATNAVKVLHYLSDPAAGQPDLAPVAKVLEEEKKPDFGPAAQAAPGVMKGLVNTVDFPQFVAGLIDGVFTSIVNSSIRQMHEFGRFLEGVVKSVEDFAQDHIQPAQARQYLQSKFPGALNMESGRLVSADSGDQPAPDFQAALGMTDKPDLDSEEGEQKLVLAAQLKLARMRQQELSQLVLMGINRIVVTEGEIKASVMFDVTSKDTAEHNDQSDRDYSDNDQSKRKTHYHEGGGWGSDPSYTADTERVRTTISTQHTHTDNKTTDEINAHAKLTGSVTVKFKSETFPLGRLASSAEVADINSKSKR